ncbi:MAG: excinuclease ABC subunit UvrC [Clostridia bacterium]|nr:excinuclease ABC subunit UvrC [Clostridia bacterium]
MQLDKLREKANTLPLTPGVYLMRNKQGDVIYVGKAKALKNRVSQYFMRSPNHTFKTCKMVQNVFDFDVINAPSELDALLLENTLIKKYKPKYNILLKDDKGYPFIRLASGDYPRFSVESRRDKPGKYFGPYGGRGTANSALKAVNDLFMLPTCSRKFPRDIGRERPCLRYHIGKCCGVCTGEVSAQEFARRIEQVCMLFGGKSAALVRELQAQMEQAAEKLEFEKAAALRDRIRTIEKLKQDTIVSASVLSSSDAIGYACKGSRGCVAALSYSNGALIGKRIIFFDGADSEDEQRDIESFLNQYYPLINTAPREIYLPCQLENMELTQAMLSAVRGAKCTLSVPQKGDKAKMTALARENALQELELLDKKEQHSQKTLESLGEMLNIPLPVRIEAIDISNTAGADAVASITVHVDGRPQKSAYKKFRIKDAIPSDDPGAIAEVLGRRLDRAIAGDEGFLPMPDLLLMDGGITQTAAAKEQLRQRGLSIPVFGMVKDGKHRTRGLVSPDGQEIHLSATPAVFALVGRIQEETHRFAVEYHQTVRRTKARSSKLDSIPGVGEKRKKDLLRHFGTVKAIASAEIDELCRVVPRDTAQNIIDFFEGERQ